MRLAVEPGQRSQVNAHGKQEHQQEEEQLQELVHRGSFPPRKTTRASCEKRTLPKAQKGTVPFSSKAPEENILLPVEHPGQLFGRQAERATFVEATRPPTYDKSCQLL